ncbi:MAG: hypothetical protein WCH42_07905 [Actinomycetes bacterium]
MTPVSAEKRREVQKLILENKALALALEQEVQKQRAQWLALIADLSKLPNQTARDRRALVALKKWKPEVNTKGKKRVSKG